MCCTRLLCMDFWLGPIFITQKPSSDFRSLLWGLNWILSILTGVFWLFSFLGWPQNVFSLTYRSATWKNRIRFHKKKKKPLPRGSVSVQEQANSGSPFTSFFDKSEFSFLTTKCYLLPKNPDASFWPEFLKFCLKEMQKSEECSIYCGYPKSITLQTKVNRFPKLKF